MPRTVDETILFLIRAAKPGGYVKVYRSDDPEMEKFTPRLRGRPTAAKVRRFLYDTISHVCQEGTYLVEKGAFEQFTGEPYSFEAHLRATHEAGPVRFQVAEPGSFYDTPTYRKVFDHTNGLVEDYTTGQVWLRFWLMTEEERKQFRQEAVEDILSLVEDAPLRRKSD